MAFQLKKISHLSRQLRKTAASRINKTLKLLDPFPQDPRAQDKAIHQARKYLKQLRALFELISTYITKKKTKSLDESVRNIAHPLGPLRDATAVLETLTNLESLHRKTLRPQLLRPVHAFLHTLQTEARQKLSLKKSLSQLRALARKTYNLDYPKHKRSLKADRAFKAAANAAHIAKTQSTNDNLHKLRKKTKTFRYALEFLRLLLTKKARTLIKKTHRLTDLLGTDHDLAILENMLTTKMPLSTIAPLLEAITRHRLHLQSQSHALAGNVYKPSLHRSLTRS